MSSSEPPTHDVERIRAAYARREGTVEPGRYAPARPGNALALEQRERVFDAALARRGMTRLGDYDILEVGCGSGAELGRFVARGADVHRLSGVDLQPQFIDQARARVPGAHLVAGDASTLPFRDGSFDIVYQAMALSSMPSSAMRSSVAAEMRRVVRPGGLIVSYDFARNPTNRDTVGIGTRELRRLFPEMRMEVHRVTLIPPIGRWLGDRSVRALKVAAAIKPLRSHRLVFFDVPR